MNLAAMSSLPNANGGNVHLVLSLDESRIDEHVFYRLMYGIPTIRRY